MLTKKIWLLIGALTVLCAGVVGVNAYLSKKPAPVTETPEEITEESTSIVPEEISLNPEIDTSDWKTYRNERYDYQIIYPGSWEVKARTGGMPCSIYNHSCISLISIEEPYPGGNQVKIAIFNNPNKLSIMDWLYKYENLKEIEQGTIGEFFFIKTIKIKEENGIRLRYIPLSKQAHMQDTVYFSKGTFMYAINFYSFSVEYSVEYDNTLNSILSSFRIKKKPYRILE